MPSIKDCHKAVKLYEELAKWKRIYHALYKGSSTSNDIRSGVEIYTKIHHLWTDSKKDESFTLTPDMCAALCIHVEKQIGTLEAQIRQLGIEPIYTTNKVEMCS